MSDVDPQVRQRGEQYARAGLVTLNTRGPETVSATVRGSEIYQVDLSVSGNVLWATCDCPYFDGELEVCKHIWATVITCVNKNVNFAKRVDRLLADETALDDHVDAWEAPTKRAPGNVVPIGREWVQPSRWRAQLGSVAARAWSDKAVTPPEITWVLDPQTSGPNVSIEITSRSLKNNGELGKPKPLTIPRSAVTAVASPLDREILAMLSSMYTYGSFETKLSIGWPLAEYLMPKLVATGRLLIRTGKGEYQPLSTFDGGEPWRLSVRCEDRGGTYTLAATLHRGEENRPLKDALAITAGGLVIFPDAITRFADDGTQAWAELLRRDEVSIPPAELDQFVKAIASSSTTIRIDFPAAVAWEERRVPLRATLELRDYGRGAIAGAPRFEYEGHAANSLEAPLVLADEKAKAIYVRDAAEEVRKLDALWGQHFVRQGSLVTLQSSQLLQAIPKLVEAGWEVRNADGIYAPPGELELTVTSSIDWFDMNGTVSFGNERVKLPRLLTAMRKGESVVRLDDGRLGMLREEWRTQLEPFLTAASDDQENGVRFRRNQVLLLDALLATRPEVSFDETFERARSRLLDVKITPGQPLESFKGTGWAGSPFCASSASVAVSPTTWASVRRFRCWHFSISDGTSRPRTGGRRSSSCPARSSSTGNRNRRASRPSCACSITPRQTASATPDISTSMTSCSPPTRFCARRRSSSATWSSTMSSWTRRRPSRMRPARRRRQRCCSMPATGSPSAARRSKTTSASWPASSSSSIPACSRHAPPG